MGNKIFILILSLSLLSVTNQIWAQCTDVIALSKVVSNVVEDESTIKQHAQNFCSEFNRSSGTSNSASYGISYKVLSASMGTESTSAESVASRYCKASNINEANENSYERYVESISPNAYSAYEKCVSMSEEDLKIEIDLAAVLPTEFAISFMFASDTFGEKAVLNFSQSEGVKCNWYNSSERELTLEVGNTGLLECDRDSSDKKSYVTVIRSNANQTMTIPWTRYNQEGVPVDLIRSVNEKYEEYNNTIESMSGAVLAFESKECPVGWSDYRPAYGRFIRGIDKAETTDPEGLREPGSHQEDMFEKHNHRVTISRADTDIIGNELLPYIADRNNPDVFTEDTGGEETRPINVALLYCQKD